jgi:hypothetical protein
METVSEDVEIKVSFAYGGQCWNAKVTYCYLYDPDGVQVGQGVAACHPTDNFNKIVGRKLALSRALKNAGLGKAERTKVWESFKATHKFVSK